MVSPIALILAGWIVFSAAVVVGTVPGSFLLDTANPPSTINGQINLVWLPFGTMVDIDGVRFKVCLDSDPPYGIYLYQPGQGIEDRGTELKGVDVQVSILDYWMVGRPTLMGMYLANVTVNRPILNMTRPLFVARPELNISPDYQASFRLTTAVGQLNWLSDVVPVSQVALTGQVVGDWQTDTITISVEWTDGETIFARDVADFKMDVNTTGWASSTSGANKFRMATQVMMLSPYADVKITTVTLEGTKTIAEQRVSIEGVTAGVQNPLAIQLSGFQSYVTTGFDNLGNGIQSAVTTLRTETANAIQSNISRFYSDVFLPNQELTREWIENISEATTNLVQQSQRQTQKAIDNLAATFYKMIDAITTKYDIITMNLSTPNLTVYKPITLPSGIPSASYIDAKNATIENIVVSDDSGVLFSGTGTNFQITPNEGRAVQMSITYRGTYTGEEKTYTENSLVTYQTGYFLDSSGNPVNLSEEIIAGINGWTLIIGGGIVSAIFIGVILWRRRK